MKEALFALIIFCLKDGLAFYTIACLFKVATILRKTFQAPFFRKFLLTLQRDKEFP